MAPQRALLLSDVAGDVHELLPGWPDGGWACTVAPLKETSSADLVTLQPDLVVVDARSDVDAAEAVTRRLSLAWEAGLPAIVVVLDDDSVGPVGRFRLDSGADDFVMVGASAAEIAARLAGATRRSGDEHEAAVLRVGDLTVNPDNYQVYVGGHPLDLTYKEFELLRFLAQRPGRVCDRDLLLREVWGYDYFGGTRTVDVHIRRLRAKLGPERETLIETIRNVGYRLVPRPRER
jgi:DNA-binding response OmpR family regulator